MAKTIWAVAASMPKSAEMSPRAAAIMLAVIRVTSWPKEKMTPIVILRHEAQLYGSSGSSGPSQVLCVRAEVLATQLSDERVGMGPDSLRIGS